MEVPPPPRVLFLLSRQKMQKQRMQVGLHTKMRVIQTNASRTWISFIWILSPQSFYISECRCFIHHSLCCQSFISIPKAYVQCDSANSNPLGEYGSGYSCELSRSICMQISTKGNDNLGRV